MPQLNDLFPELLYLVARLLTRPLHRARLRAVCKATWAADKDYRLPRPLQSYLEGQSWWQPQNPITRRQWRTHQHLFKPWIELCDTPAFRLFDRERLVPVLTATSLVFKGRVYWGKGLPPTDYEVELQRRPQMVCVHLRDGPDDHYHVKGAEQSVGDCLMTALPALAPGLCAYLNTKFVLSGRRLSRFRREDNCFYVLMDTHSSSVGLK